MARQGGHRVHPAGVVGRDRRAGTRATRPGAGVRRRPDRRVARRGSSPPSARWRRGRRADAGGELVDVSMLEALGDVPHLLPGDLQRPAGAADADAPLRPDAGVGAATRRAGRARGAGPGSSGSTSAPWSSTPSGWRTRSSSSTAPPGPDHRGVDRRPHRRRGARPGVRLPHPQRPDRQRVQHHDVDHSRPADLRAEPTGRLRRTRDRRSGSGQRSLRPPEPAPRLGEHSIDAVLAAAAERSLARRARPNAGAFRSTGCGCWT